jgi:hypothetical protein
MIPRECFVNKLRELGYTFKDRRKTNELWRKKGGTHCVILHTPKLLPCAYVAAVLRSCKVPEKEVTSFIECSRRP